MAKVKSIKIPCWSYWYYEYEKYWEVFQVVPEDYTIDTEDLKAENGGENGIFVRTIIASEYCEPEEYGHGDEVVPATGHVDYFSQNAFRNDPEQPEVHRGRLMKEDLSLYVLNKMEVG